MVTEVDARKTWLTQTKLQWPRLREDIILRPRLAALLSKTVTAHALTLISAPAGYGKTTLATSLAGQSASFRLAWLTLGPEDNDPILFIRTLVAALQTLNPACGAAVEALLDSQAAPQLEATRLIGLVINDILEALPDPFVLVLDDLHAITEPSIYAALDYLLEHLPWQMHLLVTTRTDPPLALARLRARGRLSELRPADLRFTAAEVAALLNHQLQLDLGPDDLQRLESGTEGWAAGLRLLAASLERIAPDQRAAFIQKLAPANRYVFDYLAEEILNRQEAEVQAFLLDTAILAELTPALCEAVTGRPEAGSLLQTVYHRNLFLVAVDDFAPAITTTYRYHALFAEFLRQQVARRRSPAELAELHRRAGQAEPSPSRAIAHFVAAAAWPEAAEAIERVAEATFSQGLLERLATWIQQLPAESLEDRPWLRYFLGVCAWGQGRFSEAQAFLEQARLSFETAENERGQGETMTQLSIIYQTAGNFEQGEALAKQALTPELSLRSQTQLHMAFAWLSLGRGELPAGQSHLAAALSLAETSGDSGALQILAMQLRSPFHVWPEGIALTERLIRLIDARIPDRHHPWWASALSLQAYLHFWRGHLSNATAAAEQAWALSDALGGFSWLMVEAGPMLGQLYFVQGDSARAESAFNQFTGLAEAYPGWRAAILFPYALHLWSQGRLDEAGQVYVRMHPAGQTPEWPVGPVFRPMLRGLLELADRNYGRAEQTLREAIRLQQQVPVSNRYSARLLLAYLYWRWNRPEAALHELAPLLTYYEQRSLPGFILGHGPEIVEPLLTLARHQQLHEAFAGTLLKIFEQTGASRSLHVPDTGAVLTPREVDVLRLLVTGASNKAIATELVVSLPTVKTHISRLLAKLEVKTRGAAAARARELHLI